MQFLATLHVGIPLDGQLTATPDDPFVLSGQTTPHPDNHFGTDTALERVRQIADAYVDNQAGCTDPAIRPTCPKLKINDLSLVRGGVYDLNNQWFGDNTPGKAHWGHRTGTEADIETTDSANNDTSCTTGGGGNDRVEKAVRAVIKKKLLPTVPQGATPFGPVPPHRCEIREHMPGGKNHVYLQ